MPRLFGIWLSLTSGKAINWAQNWWSKASVGVRDSGTVPAIALANYSLSSADFVLISYTGTSISGNSQVDLSPNAVTETPSLNSNISFHLGSQLTPSHCKSFTKTFPVKRCYRFNGSFWTSHLPIRSSGSQPHLILSQNISNTTEIPNEC